MDTLFQNTAIQNTSRCVLKVFTYKHIKYLHLNTYNTHITIVEKQSKVTIYFTYGM